MKRVSAGGDRQLVAVRGNEVGGSPAHFCQRRRPHHAVPGGERRAPEVSHLAFHVGHGEDSGIPGSPGRPLRTPCGPHPRRFQRRVGTVAVSCRRRRPTLPRARHSRPAACECIRPISSHPPFPRRQSHIKILRGILAPAPQQGTSHIGRAPSAASSRGAPQDSCVRLLARDPPAESRRREKNAELATPPFQRFSRNVQQASATGTDYGSKGWESESSWAHDRSRSLRKEDSQRNPSAT